MTERMEDMHQGDKYRIGIVGATGYVGMELVRLLGRHPGFRITALTSVSYEGRPFSEIYPAFTGVMDQTLRTADPDFLASACDLVITALPHGVSSEIVPRLLDRGLRVLDHSGDFRFRDLATYENAYRLRHPRPELLAEAVYGLPELHREAIRTARLVANPGCYPTSAILAIAPLLTDGLIDADRLVVDSLSGVSGAGRQSAVAYSFCEAAESSRPYGVVGHRHTAEMEQEISALAGRPLELVFTPHLVPMKRGMLTTLYAPFAAATDTVTAEELYERFNSYYKYETFVRVLPPGQLPDSARVTASNFIDIGVAVDQRMRMVKVFSALDNLGKGACSQAIQALNLMTGYPETAGIDQIGIPV